jgi:hypothetical protein
MSNRYSKTGFTARQVKTLKSMRYTLGQILVDRSSKQDSPKSLAALFRADTAIMVAIEEAEQWKKS